MRKPDDHRLRTFRNRSAAQKARATKADHSCLKCGRPARLLLCEECLADAGRAGQRVAEDARA